MATFPGAVASFAGFTSSHTLSADNHASQHNSEQAEIIAAQTKLGTGASTSSNNTVLRGTGSGTSAWGQVALTSDVTGTLPVANGGIGQATLSGLTLPSAILANPAVSGTVTGGATYSSPTLTTPVIASFSSATHNHENAAGGGTLGSNAITGIDKSVTTTDSNPYKFRAYASVNQTGIASDNYTTVTLGTEDYDTNNNFSSSTYTAPVTGFYLFACGVVAASSVVGAITVARPGILLIKNGSTTVSISHYSFDNGLSYDISQGTHTDIISLTAGDTIAMQTSIVVSSGTATVNAGLGSFMAGFLVSRT